MVIKPDLIPNTQSSQMSQTSLQVLAAEPIHSLSNNLFSPTSRQKSNSMTLITPGDNDSKTKLHAKPPTGPESQVTMDSVEDTTTFVQERFKRLKTTSLKSTESEYESRPNTQKAKSGIPTKKPISSQISKPRNMFSRPDSANHGGTRRIRSPPRKKLVKAPTATVDGSPILILKNGPIDTSKTKQIDSQAPNVSNFQTRSLQSSLIAPSIVPKKRARPTNKAPPPFMPPKRPRADTTSKAISTPKKGSLISDQPSIPEVNDDEPDIVKRYTRPQFPASGTPLSPSGSMTRHVEPFSLAMGVKRWRPKEKDPFVKEFDMNWLGEWSKWAEKRT